jgi:hypothetical protein
VKKIVAAAMAAAAIALGACESDPGDSGGGYGYYRDGCGQFASCGTCTPVNGCGWCFDSDGNGLCAASPDECATPAFSWTWNPSGCRVPAAAGTGSTVDAGTVTVGEDAALAPEVDGAVGEDAAVAVDAGSAAEASVPEGAAPELHEVP